MIVLILHCSETFERTCWATLMLNYARTPSKCGHVISGECVRTA